MSVRIMGGVWELELDPPKKLVLLSMADHADHEGRNVRPSLPLIAWKTGYSPRQVQRIVHELVADGILEIEQVGTGRGRPTHYRIRLEKGVKLSPFRADKGCQDVVLSSEKGDIHDTERVTSVQRKGDIAMSPEPLKEPSVRTTPFSLNGHTEEKPPQLLYRSVIGETTWAAVVKQFARINPSLGAAWFGQVMADAETIYGETSRAHLEEAVKITLNEVERRLKAEATGAPPIGNVKAFTRSVFCRNLEAAKGVPA